MPKSRPGQPANLDHLALSLADMDDDRLAALLRTRPDLVSPAPANFAELARRAWFWPSIASCLATQDAWCHQLVHALALLEPVTSVGTLAGVLEMEPDHPDLASGLGRLADQGLVIRGPKGVLARAEDWTEQIEYPAGLGPDARTALARQSVSQLTAIATRLGLRPPKGKTQLVEAVAEALADPAVVLRQLRAGPSGTAELVARFMDEGPVLVLPGAMYSSSGLDARPHGWLLNRGMVVAKSWDLGVLVREVGMALRGGKLFPRLVNTPPAMAGPAVDPAVVDRAAGEAALRVVSDVGCICESWSVSPPPLLKTGGLGIREIRRLSKALGRSEVEVARLVDLTRAACLVTADQVNAVALVTPAFDLWTRLSAPERWAGLVRTWLEAPQHLALAGEQGHNDKPIPALLHRHPEPAAVARRQLVLKTLAMLPVGAAAEAGGLRARVLWTGTGNWSAGPGSPTMMVEWFVTEAEMMGLVAHRSLGQAGRAAACGDLTAATAVVAAHAPKLAREFVVQADASVVAPGELAAEIRGELELIADLESRGAASVYRITEASLRRGFDAGLSAKEITRFLSEHSTRDVPQSLTYLVGDLGRRHGRVRVGTAACYLRSEDPSLLAEVVRSRSLAKLGLRLLASTVAVSGATPERMLEALRAAGHLPAAEDAGGALVLTRPPRHRSKYTPKPAAAPKAVTFDPVPVVARLRKAPRPPRVPALRSAPPPPPPRGSKAAGGRTEAAAIIGPPVMDRHPGSRSAPAPDPEKPTLFGPPARPALIAKDSEDITTLLEAAQAMEWAVRLAYTNRKGQSAQMNLALLDPPRGNEVVVEVLPSGTSRVLLLDRIEWARIMTEAEEDLLY
ncbi:MAG: helicase-associated domain-containing protein [Acidimicrobiales bacterium]